jgi:hypothetical protein
MTKVENKIDQSSQRSAENPLGNTILSPEDIEHFLRGFILDWLRGKVTIRFPSGDEVKHEIESESTGRVTLPGVGFNPFKAKARREQDFRDLVEICGGTKAATREQVDKAKVELFHKIMHYKSSERIDGVSQDSELERRIATLEKKLAATNKLAEEAVKYLRAEDGANGNLS